MSDTEQIKKSFAFVKKHGIMHPIKRTAMTTPLMKFYVTHDGHCPQGIRHHILEGDFNFIMIRNAYCVGKRLYDELTEEDCYDKNTTT